jgi:hypothetical protein
MMFPLRWLDNFLCPLGEASNTVLSTIPSQVSNQQAQNIVKILLFQLSCTLSKLGRVWGS